MIHQPKRESAGLSVIGRASSSTGDVADITAGSDNQVLRRSGTSLGFGQVATGGIADLAITTAKIASGAVGLGQIADNNVDDTKVGNRVPQLYRRQGGDASDWSVAGTTTRIPGAVRMQAGVREVTISAGSNFGSATITFPTAFSDKPIVTCSLAETADTPNDMLWWGTHATAAGTATIYWQRSGTTGTVTLTFNWIAIGPE